MKKFAFIIATVFAITFANNTNAQVQESQTINLSARLTTTMALTLDQADINFNFVTLAQYKDGLGGYEGDYSSEGSVSSTANWKLSFLAKSEFLHEDGSTIMPLDNVGLSAKWTGENKMKNNAKKNPLALSQNETVILDQQGHISNAGDDQANSFIIYWEMGTKKGDMNKQSIFEQDLKKGLYNTQVEFLATEIL